MSMLAGVPGSGPRICETVRDFVRERLTPNADQWDRERRFPKEALKELGALGTFGMLVPSDWGGAAFDRLTLALTLESVAAGDGSSALILAIQNTRICHLLETYGSMAQKSRWLVGAATGSLLGCYCFAEDRAGQDLSFVSTTARKQGNCWKLDGAKELVTSGTTAQVAVVFARALANDGSELGLSCFLVPTDSAGYRARRIAETSGLAASDLAEVRFEGCQIPSDCLLGNEGDGEQMAVSGIGDVYLALAALAVGLGAQAASECPGCSLESVTETHRSQMALYIQAASYYVRGAARLSDSGRSFLNEASLAKHFAMEAVGRICWDCSGGNSAAATVSRARRDLRALKEREYGLLPKAMVDSDEFAGRGQCDRLEEGAV